MRFLVALLLLSSCGAGWEPSNIEQIKADVWESVSRDPINYDYLDLRFVDAGEIPELCDRAPCQRTGGCYWPDGRAYVSNYRHNCGHVLAHELTHYVLHMDQDDLDHNHSLIPIWWGDLLKGYDCAD